jgi:CheY-like chemotaxis protein
MTNRRILVVEDSPELRLMLKKYAQDEGAELDAVGSGEEALALFRIKPYNLIFLDLFLEGGQDGFDLFKKMKEEVSRLGRACPPVIALSASSFAEDREKCRALGFKRFVQKPFRRSDIIGLFRRYLHIKPSPLSWAGLDQDVVALLPDYIRNRQKDLSDMRAAWLAGDRATVTAIGHRVKGSAGAFGLDQLGLIAGRLEAGTGEGRGEDVEAALSEFEDFLKAFCYSHPGLIKAGESEKIKDGRLEAKEKERGEKNSRRRR